MGRGKEIYIDIDDEGNVSIEGHGFHGPECELAINEISHALGIETERKLKAEHRERVTRQTNRQNLGR